MSEEKNVVATNPESVKRVGQLVVELLMREKVDPATAMTILTSLLATVAEYVITKELDPSLAFQNQVETLRVLDVLRTKVGEFKVAGQEVGVA
jgi:hypothetical protein